MIVYIISVKKPLNTKEIEVQKLYTDLKKLVVAHTLQNILKQLKNTEIFIQIGSLRSMDLISIDGFHVFKTEETNLKILRTIYKPEDFLQMYKRRYPIRKRVKKYKLAATNPKNLKRDYDKRL